MTRPRRWTGSEANSERVGPITEESRRQPRVLGASASATVRESFAVVAEVVL